MFLAADLNRAKVFQRFGGWHDSVSPKLTGEWSSVAVFLHRANAALLYLERMRSLANDCTNEFERLSGRLALNSKRISFWSPSLAELLFQLSPFFTAMVVLQNSLLGLAAQKVGRAGTIPASLNAFLSKSLHYPWFDQEVVRLLDTYWKNGGERLREYRDLDQHYHVLSRHAFFEIEPERRVRVFLPDDAYVKSPSKYSFGDEVDALEYCQTEFSKFDELCDSVADRFGFPSAALSQPMNLFEPYQVLADQGTKTVALLVQDIGRFEAVELGQVAGESQMYVKQLARGNGGS